MLRRPHCIVALARYHVIPQAQRRLFSHSRPAALSLFGWKLSLPVPSNEPLASDIPWLFLAELGIGLPLALWTYKCLMMIAFQRKIIYLPPYGSRNESLTEGERSPALDSQLAGMRWTQREVVSGAKSRWLRQEVKLRGIELESDPWSETESANSTLEQEQPHVVVIYLQGNAGTPLLRLPLFRRLLSSSAPSSHKLTISAFAPRSFWLSSRSTPTESTVLADYAAVITSVAARFPAARLVLYGHSLGGAAAVLLFTRPALLPTEIRQRIAGIVLENPLPSIPFMVRALYPQKWLPYHWLGPFVFDRWDALGALRRLEVSEGEQEGAGATLKAVKALWIRSGVDEIIPRTGKDGDGVELMKEAFDTDRRKSGSTPSKWITVEGALHDTAYEKRAWREAMGGFLADVAEKGSILSCRHPSER